MQPEANDNLEFCSSQCCTNYYQIHPFCDVCGKKHSGKKDNSWFTWNNLEESDKDLIEYLESQGKYIKKDYTKKFCLPYCLWKDGGINEAIENWGNEDWDAFGKWKLDKKDKQTDKGQWFNKDNSFNPPAKVNLPSEKGFKSEEQTQNNPTQELNNSKNKPNLNANEQARIKELERELEAKQVGQKGNNYKLWLGIGCGVLGMSLVGLVFWLVRRKKRSEK